MYIGTYCNEHSIYKSIQNVMGILGVDGYSGIVSFSEQSVQEITLFDLKNWQGRGEMIESRHLSRQ